MNLRSSFSLRTAIIGMSVFAMGFWTYGQVLPMWQRYQQLQAAIKFTPDKSYVEFDEVVVNLASAPQQRFLCVDIALQVDRKNELLLARKIEHNRIALHDCLISYLRGKKVDELHGTEGIETVRHELLERFQDILSAEGSDELQKVVFENFLVQ